jgi:undecaprenyl-diphosphatase
MIEILKALVLGIIQGLTEFIPVSSSGHLALARDILNINYSSDIMFDVLLHFATLLAVAIYFFKDIINLFKPPYKTLLYLIIATIPAAVVMFFVKDYVDLLFGGSYLCFAFLITAILLLVTEIFIKKEAPEGSGIDAKKSLIMGAAQCVAIIPGISRSGSTICTGLLAGGDRKSVARFSFLMSMPIILGSAIVSLFEFELSSMDVAPLLAGMAAAFFAAIFAIKIMITAIQKVNFKWFAFYLFALSAVTFIDSFVINIW